jgi:hypothetical protein
MNAKIERVCKEIEKTRVKINDQQTRLRELEKQKTELENTEIVDVVRGMNISFADLAELLKAANATSGQIGPKLDAVKSVENSNDDDSDDNEEDNE